MAYIADTFYRDDEKPAMAFSELRQRRGLISLSLDMLEDNWSAVMEALYGAIIVRAECNYSRGCIDYEVLAPGFFDVPEGGEAVRYYLHSKDDGKIIVGRHPWNMEIGGYDPVILAEVYTGND